MLLSLWQLALHVFASPAGISAVIIAAVVLAARVSARPAAISRPGVLPALLRTAARVKSGPAPARQRDPDAPGRARPRAPSAAPAAA